MSDRDPTNGCDIYCNNENHEPIKPPKSTVINEITYLNKKKQIF